MNAGSSASVSIRSAKRDAVEDRAHFDQGVVLALRMRADAGIGPVFGPCDEARANWIERDVAHGGDQAVLVHRNRAEAPLKQMAGLASRALTKPA